MPPILDLNMPTTMRSLRSLKGNIGTWLVSKDHANNTSPCLKITYNVDPKPIPICPHNAPNRQKYPAGTDKYDDRYDRRAMP